MSILLSIHKSLPGTIFFSAKNPIKSNLKTLQFFTWNEQTQGCGLRFFTPTNFVIASGQRFGTKTIIVNAPNTVPVGSAFSTTSPAKCKESCFKDQRCKSWTFNGSKSANPNVCALNFGQPVRALRIGVNTGVISGLRQCKK